jgi:hypothetical protein
MLLTRGHLLDDFKGQIFLIRFFGHRKTKRSIMKQVALVFYYDLSWCIAVLAVINGASLFLVMWLCMIIAISFSWPWGEGERHIALGTVAASILAATVVSNQIFVIIPLFLAETAVILRTSIRILRNRCLISVDERLLEVFDDIKSQSDNSLFLCLPPVYSFATAYFTQKKVLYGDGTSQDGVLFQAQVLDATNTEEGLNLLTSQYPVTHLFVDRNTFPMAINSDQWESLLRKERFEVLKRRIALEK